MASSAHVAIRALRPENAARLCRCAAAENAAAPLPLAPSAYTGKCIGSATTSCPRDKTRLHQEPTHTSTRNHWSAYDWVRGAQDTAFTPSSPFLPASAANERDIIISLHEGAFRNRTFVGPVALRIRSVACAMYGVLYSGAGEPVVFCQSFLQGTQLLLSHSATKNHKNAGTAE